MAREDVHGAALAELYGTTEHPLTLSEAAEIVGCSRQRAFAWADTHRTRLLGVATGERNAVRYMGRNNPHVLTWRRENDTDSNEDLTIGSVLTVSALSVKNGHVVLRLAGINGEEVEAVMASA